MTASDNDTAIVSDVAMQARCRRVDDALDTLPRLTRAVFVLHSADDLSYAQIAWRCGMTTDEVVIRMADALTGIRRHDDSAPSMMGRIRYAWVPWQSEWMRWRRERQDRSLGIKPRNRQ